MSPAVASGFFTTETSGKPHEFFFFLTHYISERELTTQYRLVEKGLGVFSELESQGLESFSVALLAATVPAALKMQTHCDRWAGTSSVGSPSLGSLEGAWPGKARQEWWQPDQHHHRTCLPESHTPT